MSANDESGSASGESTESDVAPSASATSSPEKTAERELAPANTEPTPLPPANASSLSQSRDQLLVQAVLGAALLAIVLTVAAATGGRGSWVFSRLIVFAVPGLVGIAMLTIGLRTRKRLTPAPGLAEAQARPHPTLLRRLLAAIEPFETAIVFAVALALLIPGVWSYSLIDPWEGHYAEVARRILQDSDWVHLKWQNEVFRSKPVLTFWLIAASMNSFGIAQDGGFSGEMLSTAWVTLAVRLPFIVFGAAGITAVFWMLRRLLSRRVAWMAAGVLVTTTFYFMVARQAITDMPMVACVMIAVSLFIMTLERGSEPLESVIGRLAPNSQSSRLGPLAKITALHIFVVALVAAIGFQALYYGVYFSSTPLARGIKIPAPGVVLGGWMLIWLAALCTTMFIGFRAKTKGQVWMFWFYVVVGIAFLAKGPPGLGLVGVVCLAFLVLSGRWALLRRLEIIRGVFITSIVAVPWHIAMWLRDGPAWVNEYFNHHMFGRFTKGVHGDRGTFEYFASQLGIGMWPWAALVPAAIATAVITASLKNRESRVRLVIGLWATAGVAMFAISQTKFHHYILPAVPALAILVAFFLDDVWRGRISRLWGAAAAGLAILCLICRDLLGEQEKLIELYIYRYDRPWPLGDPWTVDITDRFLLFGVLFAIVLAALALPVMRRVSRKLAIGSFFGLALVWMFWAGTGYMQTAAPHWGQRALHEVYYAERQIHGIDLRYYGLRELADDWDGRNSMSIRSLLPTEFAVGQPQVVALQIPNVGIKGGVLSLAATVTAIGDDAFTVTLNPGESGKLSAYIEQGRTARRAKPRWRQVNADRLITWQLNWRGENFWSAGEIYGETEDTRTVFTKTDNKEFKKYIKKEDKKGRTFYVITEAGRAKGMKGVLPSPQGKETFEILDTTNNKFTLMRFRL